MFEKLETFFEKWKDWRNKKSFYQRDIRKKEKKRLSKATKYLENSFVFEKCETSFEEWEDCRNKKSFYLSLSRHCQPTRVIKLFQLCHKKPTSHLRGGICSSNWFFSCPKTMSWPCPYDRSRNQKINDSQEASDNHKEPGWHFYFRVFRAQQSCRRDFQWLMKVIRRMGMSNMTQRQRQYDLSFQMFYTGRRRWSGVTQKQYSLSNDCLSSPAI